MLSYRNINHLGSALLIHHTAQYVKNVFSTNMNFDLQITVTNEQQPIRNCKTRCRLIGLQLWKKKVDVRFGNYNYGNNICYLPCGHNFHFPCIEYWLRRNRSCSICKESNLWYSDHFDLIWGFLCFNSRFHWCTFWLF